MVKINHEQVAKVREALGKEGMLEKLDNVGDRCQTLLERGSRRGNLWLIDFAQRKYQQAKAHAIVISNQLHEDGPAL